MFLKHALQLIFLTLEKKAVLESNIEEWNLTLKSVQEREVFAYKLLFAFCQKEHIHYLGAIVYLCNSF